MSKTTNFQIRINPATHKRIAEAAERSGRSTNAEYVYRLDQSLDDDGQLRRELTEIKRRLAEIERILADRK